MEHALEEIPTKKAGKKGRAKKVGLGITVFPLGYWKEYQLSARRTAIYTNAGDNFTYPILGLAGEVGELQEMLFINSDIDPENPKVGTLTIAELGDTLWYMSAIASEFMLNLDDIMQSAVERLMKAELEPHSKLSLKMGICTSRLAEFAKKLLRDQYGIYNRLDKERAQVLLTDFACLWLEMNTSLGVSPVETADFNLEKLFGRQERGTLSGSGNKR